MTLNQRRWGTRHPGPPPHLILPCRCRQGSGCECGDGERIPGPGHAGLPGRLLRACQVRSPVASEHSWSSNTRARANSSRSTATDQPIASGLPLAGASPRSVDDRPRSPAAGRRLLCWVVLAGSQLGACYRRSPACSGLPWARTGADHRMADTTNDSKAASAFLSDITIPVFSADRNAPTLVQRCRHGRLRSRENLAACSVDRRRFDGHDE